MLEIEGEQARDRGGGVWTGRGDEGDGGRRGGGEEGGVVGV